MIQRITAATPLDRSRLGGKGCGLVRLLRAGFEVPATWCIPPAARGADPGALAAACAELWRGIVTADAEAAVAVRSSATVEDQAGASAAGVYRSQLGVVGAGALHAAVLCCRRSLDGAAAQAYRAEHPDHSKVAMAVIVQRMVAAEVAGVLFTANPQRPFADELVIAAGRGLGETVVGATADTDLAIVTPRHGRVIEDRRAGNGLDDRLLARLVELADRLERRLGPHLDCEWALAGGRILLLQERPLVGLPPRAPREVWSRKFGDEYLAGYTTPLTQTLLLPWIADDYLAELARLMGRRDLAGMTPLRRHNGYQYFSGRYLAQMLQVVPPRRRAANTQGWFTPLWQRQIAAEPFALYRLLPMLAAPLRDPGRATLAGNLHALARHRARVDRELGPGPEPAQAELADPEWRQRLDRARELGREHFRIIRWGMGLFHPLLHAALRGLLVSVAGADADRLYPALIGGTATDTTAINQALWRLGRQLDASPVLAARVASQGSYPELRVATAAEGFWARFDQFLARHGHRGGSRDLGEPRWFETPELVLSLLRAQIGTPDPARALARASAARSDATRELMARLGQRPGASLHRLLVRRLLARVTDYTRYRENQRHSLDLITFALRRLVRRRGHVLTRAGLLANPDRVFFLEADELLRPLPGGVVLGRPSSPPAVLDGWGPPLAARIEARYQHYLTHRNRLPASYLFDGVETEGEILEGPRELGAVIADAGIGVSRGVARGCGRAVETVGDLATVRAGEILIARNIDPGWTSAFPRVAAIVTETGGMLSHGALLAREYGIPAVMGIAGAADRFSGREIEVNGSTGRVHLVR